MVVVIERMVGQIMMPGFQCERCSHTWTPRKRDQMPTVCPACKSAYWNRPRQQRKSIPAKEKGRRAGA